MAQTATTSRPGRNERCHCDSGKKYKHCCLAKDEAADRKAREKADKAAEKAAAKAAKAKGDEPAEDAEAAEAEAVAPRKPPRPGSEQPWKRSAQNTRGFHRVSGVRKVGGGG